MKASGYVAKKTAQVVCAIMLIGLVLLLSACPDNNGTSILNSQDIVIVNSISGDESQCEASCPADTCGQGVFLLVLNVTNPDSRDIEYTLPAGIQFIPDNTTAQTMMLLQVYVTTIKAGETKTICLPVFCLAVELDAPDAGDSYRIEDVTSHSVLKEIIALTAGKTITFDEAFEIQLIIWDCLERGSLTTAERNYLESV